MRKILYLLAILFFITLCQSKNLSTPRLQLGEEINPKDEHQKFYIVNDITITKDKKIYVLDSGNGRIQKFSMNGVFIKSIGKFGEGKNEFFKPRSICSINDDLWIADLGNGRIQIYRHDKFSRSITFKNVSQPAYIANAGNAIFVCGENLGNSKAKNIVLTDRKGAPVKTISAGIDVGSKENRFWNFASIAGLKNRCLVGFHFHNTIKIIDDKGDIVIDKDMTPFYRRYEAKSEGLTMPNGFSALTFSKGPAGSILVVTCDFDKKICNRILQFNGSLTKQLNEYHFSDCKTTIKRIKYFPHANNTLVLITNTDKIIFYEFK